MSSRPELKIDWCTHGAAKWAVEHWHYSRRMPMPPLLRCGVWEGGVFKGCLLFNRGANYQLASPYGLTGTEVAELVRIALTEHEWPVSRIMSIATRFLTARCPGIRLIVSFADPTEGHHGGIYQASNWMYTGTTSEGRQYFANGRWVHSREIEYGGFGRGRSKKRDHLKKRKTSGKHRYLMPLDEEMRQQIEPLRKPYPKRVRSVDGDTSAIHAEEGGSIPTRTLSESTIGR
jgi:hypothetical protein